MISWPFDSLVSDDGEGNLTYDRAFNSANLRKIFHMLYTNGVAMTEDSTALQVVPNSGMSVSVNAGMAIIEGAMGFQEEAAVISLDAAHATYARIDTIVARLNTNLSGRSISLEVLTGTAADTPAVPAITRAGNIYDLRLADINIPAGATAITATMITDTRLDDGCGIATARPETVDTSSIYDQYQASLEAYMSFVRDCMDETIAGNLQNFVTQSLSTKVDKTGDTMSGDLSIEKDEDACRIKVKTSHNGDIVAEGGFRSTREGSGGSFGVYDDLHRKWLLKANEFGDVLLNIRPVILYGIKVPCTKVGTTYEYTTVNGLSNWNMIVIKFVVHEQAIPLYICKWDTNDYSLCDNPAAGRFRGTVKVDWDNNRIGVRCIRAGNQNNYAHLIFIESVTGVF